MKAYKKLIICALTVFMGIIALEISSIQVNAANTVKLYLNHNAYVYNSKGIRMRRKNNYIKKNKVIIAPGNLKKTDIVKRYYTMNITTTANKDQKTTLYWLPYKTIKKQEYYRISKNRYIKCINVDAINNKENILSTNYATVTVSYEPWLKHVYAQNDLGKDTSKILKAKSKLVVDEFDFLGHQSLFSYHIKDTPYWIYSGDVEKDPRHPVSAHPIKSNVNGKITKY